MSLVGNLWNRLRGTAAQAVKQKRARRLFLETLESRQLMVANVTVTITDNFANQMPPQPVTAGAPMMVYTIAVKNDTLDDMNSDAKDVQITQQTPTHTKHQNAIFDAMGSITAMPGVTQPGKDTQGEVVGTIA